MENYENHISDIVSLSDSENEMATSDIGTQCDIIDKNDDRLNQILRSLSIFENVMMLFLIKRCADSIYGWVMLCPNSKYE